MKLQAYKHGDHGIVESIGYLEIKLFLVYKRRPTSTKKGDEKNREREKSREKKNQREKKTINFLFFCDRLQ